MWRFSLVAVLVVSLSVVIAAQKVSTPAQLDVAMKRVGQSQQAVSKAIMAMAYTEAKAQLAIVKQALADAEGFWVGKKKEDAVQMSKEVTLKISALDKALSAASPDNTAVMAAFKELGTACRNCHMAYREQDANQNFILKPGAVQ